MKILSINTVDIKGGAARVANDLKKELIGTGCPVKMFVGSKFSNNNDVFSFRKGVSKKLSEISKAIIKKDLPGFLACNSRNFFRKLIANDIDFFGEAILKSEHFKEADIIHCHNLHGNYFTFSLLEKISRIKPVVWTLHDMWAITGHCAHSFDCGKWKEGCGRCPRLDIYPSLLWDNSKYLWRRKKEIYEKSRLNIVVPSLWLKNKVEQSILKDQNIKLIYNGVDEKIFRQYDKIASKRKLGLPAEKIIISTFADGGARNTFKGPDYFNKITEYFSRFRKIIFLNIGCNKNDDRLDRENIINLNYIKDKSLLAQYYSASDIFLFTSIAENFPLTVLEAMACGTPIVSFDVGGVKEAVSHKQNGYIAQYRDESDLIGGIEYILESDNNKIKEMSLESIGRVRDNFTLDIMARKYLELYQSLL